MNRMLRLHLLRKPIQYTLRLLGFSPPFYAAINRLILFSYYLYKDIKNFTVNIPNLKSEKTKESSSCVSN